MVNSKKIMSDLVKNFYKKRDKFEPWQVAKYDSTSLLVLLNGYSIFRVLKDEILPIRENERGIKGENIRKMFDADIPEDYKKAENVEINKMYIPTTKKFYNCLDDVCYFDNDLMKYLDNKTDYAFYYRDAKSPFYIIAGRDYKVALVLPVKIK